MLAPSTPIVSFKQGFLLEFVDGALRSELYPGANEQTLSQYMRALTLFGQGLLSHVTAPVVATPAPEPQKLHTPELAPASEASQASRIGSNSIPGGETGGTAKSHNTSSPSQLSWLSEAILEWRTRGAIRFSQNTWTYSYEPSFRIMREILGTTRRNLPVFGGEVVENGLDVPLQELNRKAVENFSKQLQKLPSRQGKRNDGLEAHMRIAKATAERLPVQSAQNVAKHLGIVFPFFEHAAKKEWISRGVADELKLELEGAEARAEMLRAAKGVSKPGAVALTREELSRTYESDLYLQHAIKTDWKHWNDPIRLYAACRVSEAAQLFTNDIIDFEGVPCFSFVNDPPEDDAEENGLGKLLSKATSVEEYRRLKNHASRRIIPVHPALLELGFMDWVRERQEIVGRVPDLLFFELNWQPKSGYGRRPSEHTLELLKAAGVWQRRRKVGHSLRATCIQELDRVGMDGELLDRYIGHSTKTMRGESYSEADVGRNYPVLRALEFLKKTDFGVKFPTYAEIKNLRQQWARDQQLERKNSFARSAAGVAIRESQA